MAEDQLTYIGFEMNQEYIGISHVSPQICHKMCPINFYNRFDQ